MATDNLETGSRPATAGPLSEAIREAFIAYRRTMAAWDAYMYATTEEKREDERDQAFCKEQAETLNSLLLTPAENLHDLALKLRIYNAEEIDDNWTMARPITALLAEDGQRLIAIDHIEKAGFGVSSYARRNILDLTEGQQPTAS